MENTEILKRLDDDKLIDVVRNYKRYGYDDELRDCAIEILCTHGWTVDDLPLANLNYDEAAKQYHAYCRNSLIAICALIFSIGFLILIYFFFLFLAYRNVTKFYQALGENNDNSRLFSAIGVVAYFHLKEKMAEELKWHNG